MSRWKIAHQRDSPRDFVACEIHDDGTATVWGFGRPPIGTTGRPHPDTVIRDPKNKREREEIARTKARVAAGIRHMDALYRIAKANEAIGKAARS